MNVEILKDSRRLKSLKNLLEFLENNLWYYHKLVNKANIKVYSDIIITFEDLMNFIDEDIYRLLLENNIIRHNPINDRIIEFININKMIELLNLLTESRSYKLPIDLLKSKNPYLELLEYVAPHVKETPLIREIKKVMLLQLFSDGDRGIRTRIHIGIVGVPGTGKTLLLQWQADVSDGLMVSLRATSAGLSGSLNPEALQNSPPILMAADGRILCIDEADKIKQNELDPLLTAMEEGRVVLSGAQVKIEYPSRVRVFLSSNRKTFRQELIDRFDLFAFFRRYSKSEVKEVISHLVDISNNPEIIESGNELIKKYIIYTGKFYPKIENNAEVSRVISEIVEKTNIDSVRAGLRWLRFAYAYARINRTNITADTVWEVYNIINTDRVAQQDFSQ